MRENVGMRVVQLSDTHLSAAQAIPTSLLALLDWIRADPPDLLIHTGDVVWEDPDDAVDRQFAHDVLGDVACAMATIPGNHDVGFFDQSRLDTRLDAFRSMWGDNRFALDVADGWRLVGIDVYAVGRDEDDDWVRVALDTSAPIAVFVHQPLAGEPEDGWQLPDHVRSWIVEQLADRDVRLVASGHRHCRVVSHPTPTTAHVWAPSTSLTGTPYHGSDPTPGAVEYTFGENGSWSSRFVDGSVTGARPSVS